jgi:hypothetical protein
VSGLPQERHGYCPLDNTPATTGTALAWNLSPALPRGGGKLRVIDDYLLTSTEEADGNGYGVITGRSDPSGRRLE